MDAIPYNHVVDSHYDVLLVLLDSFDDIHNVLYPRECDCDDHLDTALSRYLDRNLLGVLRPVRQ